VVDDGSVDGSAAVARGYGSRGVTVATQPNRGASAARNHGLRLARGQYLQFLDADDLLAPDKISRQMEAAARAGPDAALCARWSRFTESPADADHTPQILCRDGKPVEWLAAKLGGNAMMHPGAWLISRSLAERAGPWDESLTLDDDGEYFGRVVLASSRVLLCEGAVSFYRSGLPGSLSGAKSDAAWASAYRSLELTAARLQASEDSPRTRSACATAFQQYIYDAYPRAPGCRRSAAVHVARLGGTDLRPAGGARFRLAGRLLGWRLAKRLSAILR